MGFGQKEGVGGLPCSAQSCFAETCATGQTLCQGGHILQCYNLQVCAEEGSSAHIHCDVIQKVHRIIGSHIFHYVQCCHMHLSWQAHRQQPT
jgi:hypothetical protein